MYTGVYLYIYIILKCISLKRCFIPSNTGLIRNHIHKDSHFKTFVQALFPH